MTPVLELVVFTGVQASGKTTFYRERLSATHVHVSKDLWPNARKKEERQRQLIEDHLRAGRSVVVDNTNPTTVERTPLIAIGRYLGARIVSYAFITVVADALDRNARRDGRARIPNVGIYFVAKRLVFPSDAEGFDQRFEVRLSEGRFIVTPRWERTQ
jgi:predicted kinase